MFNKKIVFFAAIIIVFLGGFFFFRSKKNNQVESYKVQKGTIKEELVLTGSLKAEEHAILSFPSGGKIAWIGVLEGQKVVRGQALISLNKTVLNTIYQQALNTHKAYQAAAENAVDSVKDHASDETFAQKSTRTTAEVNRDNAYDAVLAAKYNLDNATLYAPFSGIVSSLLYSNVGVTVSLTDKIVEVVNPETIYFEVDADQNEITNIIKDQKVEIILDSFEDKIISGKVFYVGLTPKVNESGVIYKVKVKLDDNDNLRVGMTGDAKFVLSQKNNVLYAPLQFINSDKDGQFVYLDKPKNRVSVKTGIEGEENIEIIDGVKEGDILYD